MRLLKEQVVVYTRLIEDLVIASKRIGSTIRSCRNVCPFITEAVMGMKIGSRRRRNVSGSASSWQRTTGHRGMWDTKLCLRREANT